MERLIPLGGEQRGTNVDWVWPLYEKTVRKRLDAEGVQDPSPETLEARFIGALGRSTVTLLVQEPWRGSVRFKCLARYDRTDMFDLLSDPETFLVDRFGGGKFKLNFHEGWNFVATINFKPKGDPLWVDLPELDLSQNP